MCRYTLIRRNWIRLVFRAHQITPKNIYNIDEKRIQLGEGCNNSSTLYFFDREDKYQYILKLGSLVLITVIEAVLCRQDPGSFQIYTSSGVTETENGRTNDTICHQWFNKVFLPFAKSRGDPTKIILLIFDGHSSHKTTKMSSLSLLTPTNMVTMISVPSIMYI
ncbi:hypothetical protein M422DRAFT_170191 [Sphaerobolus stellatus SS14]|uniref:DDE-1 domain-containing protein n=1 Tax=Sphaerobolus stellatus (strain SS14) TaxID=990650 RepID=A0A0C9UJL0_SPHS4|nr:hypothetical protein M422DRAFT_170191 [Sphaerobolus stellatus SS14]